MKFFGYLPRHSPLIADNWPWILPLLICFFGLFPRLAPAHSEPIVHLVGSGVRNRTLNWENGDTDVIQMNLSVNLSITPNLVAQEAGVCAGKIGHVTGSIRAWGKATRTSADGHAVQDLNFDNTSEYDLRGFPVVVEFERKDGRVTRLDSQLAQTVSLAQVTPWALTYSASAQAVDVWVSLPRPFSLSQEYVDEERYRVQANTQETGVATGFSGTVRDCRTGRPVERANVTFNSTTGSSSVITDSSGSFHFENVSPGPLNVTVSKPGFVTSISNKLMPAVCPVTQDIELDGQVELAAMEVVQSIQDLNNRIRLIENKETMVRAHFALKSLVGQPVKVGPVKLTARRDGIPLVPELWPDHSFLDVAWTDASSERGDLSHSINFQLPRDWLHGTVELTLEAAGLDCQSVTSTVIHFDRGTTPKVRLVGVRWWDSTGSLHSPPSHAHMLAMAEELRAMYPTAEIDCDYTLSFDFGWVRPDLALTGILAEEQIDRFGSSLCESLNLVRGRSFADGERIWYGAVNGFNFGGLAIGIDSFGQAPNGAHRAYVACGAIDRPGSYGWNRHAHEIGHVIGMRHAPFCITDLRAIDPQAPPYPYDTLGPSNRGIRSVVYGLNLAETHPFVVDPADHFELMSYCGSRTDDFRWISDYSYELVYSHLLRRFPQGLPRLHDTPSPIESLLVRGLIDTTTGDVDFLPFAPVPDAAVFPESWSGDYTLVVRDAASAVTRRIPVEPVRGEADFPAGVSTVGFFQVAIPRADEARKVELYRGNEVIAVRTASRTPPSVRWLLAPVAGTTSTNEFATLEWEGSDLDGDSLTYSMEFSPDGGASWQTVAVDQFTNRMDLELRTLPETKTARLKVTASDGFHISSSVLDHEFSVPNALPTLVIQSPTTGSVFFAFEQIALRAYANDFQDGALSGTNMVWTSDLNGVLGFGRVVIKNSQDLAEGNHRLSVTAYDMSGGRVVQEVQIRINRDPEPLLSFVNAGAGIVLRWSSTLSNFTLESAPQVSGNPNWNAVNVGTPRTVGDSLEVALPVTSTQQFFRLRKP